VGSKLADARRARAIAIAAASRGLIDAQSVWDAACRWTLGGATSPLDLFEGLLTAEQLVELSGEPSERPAPEGELDLAREEEAFEDATSIVPPEVSGGTLILGELNEPRYVFSDELGVGGEGKVVKAYDRVIGRTVALKTLRDGVEGQPGIAERFLHAARVTAQIEHPNIVPVYDIGALASGKPYYTMRVVKRQSLQDVLASDDLRKHWPLVRLIGAFVQISRALAYAHKRRVIHRDIKPENILLGDFGEVYLSDWGNAKVLGSAETEPVELDDHPYDPEREPSGLSGTPGYIAPEQIRGDRQKIDHRADIFALGVVLYEILTGEHPFDAPTVLGVILATQTRAPRPPRGLVPNCPLLLEDLCLSMLAKDPADRPESADRVAAEAEAFLEGAKERTRRRDEARRLCELAKIPVQRSRSLGRDRQQLVAEARRLLQDVKGYEPIDLKRPGWQLEDRATAVEREQARAMAEAIELYTKSLAFDPELVDARAGLADLYWARALEAEQERRQALQVYYEALVSEYDVGRYASLLKADAALSVESSVPGAVVLCYHYVEKDRVLGASEQRYLGRTPLHEVRLPPGSYLIILRHPRYCDVRYPVLLGRGEHYRIEVNLYTREEVGDDFVFVPGGPFIAGGDPVAPEALERDTHDVGDFAIARFPVTFRQYCAFLDHLQQLDPELARRRAPHDLSGAVGHTVRLGPDGHWEPLDVLMEGEARKMFPIEEGHLWNVPVPLVNWFDAVAYCRWRSDVEGTAIRLPTELEWEKAARGTDGRLFPWGDHFDPTFCLMRSSRPFIPQPEPIGTFPTDTSPYEVRDMAGGMREWMGDVFGDRTWDEAIAEPELSADTERAALQIRVARGGSWVATSEYCRAAARTRFFSLTRGTGVSFRIARSLSRSSR